MTDIRFALRQFAKAPGFAATVILTIALGIGANTAIFTLVHAILLKSLPVANPASLYRVGDLDDCCVNGGFINDNGDFDLFSYDLYRHFQDTTPEFEQLAAFQSGQATMNVRVGNNAAVGPEVRRIGRPPNMFPGIISPPLASEPTPAACFSPPTTSLAPHP